MKAKVLLAPMGKNSSFIAAVDGKLRIVDGHHPCHGYRNGCICKTCSERAAREQRKARHLDAIPSTRCSCERPLIDHDAMVCIKCGRRSEARAA